MKRLTLLLLALVTQVSLSLAIPAKKGAVVMTQPDGSTVTISLHGDEWQHYETTDDGYTVVRDGRGYYVYAEKQGGMLLPTAYIAHNALQRDAQETTYLQHVERHLKPEMTERMKIDRARVMEEQKKSAAQKKAVKAARADSDPSAPNYRSVAILVQFNDRSFSRSDYGDIMRDMFNKVNYDGYMSTNGWSKVHCTGSVRDYFTDNSGGKFRPQFDVYGPYTIDYSQYDANGTANAAQLIYAAVNAADDDIDFSLYDNDGDNAVDNIYFIFAGYGANYGGNDQRYFWPHRNYVYQPDTYDWVVKDGVYLFNYASSVEYYGYQSYPSTVYLDGVGTICHEFSHVLGLPDFYDADYAQSGGESNTPAEWSVMAAGSYMNNGRTPVAYSLFERAFVGFLDENDIPTLSETGNYTLDYINQSNTGFMLETPDENEAFFLENRQQKKWDAYLPGHGLLVFRADFSNTNVWQENSVNNAPSHQYYELVRATGGQGATAADAFPGTGHVTTLNNSTLPANLLTWSGKANPFGLSNIREQNGVVSFDLVETLKLTGVSLPDTLTVGLGMNRLLQVTVEPEYAPHTLVWSSGNPDVVTIDETGRLTGVALGETMVKVVANEGFTDSCLVIVNEVPVANDIAEFKSFAENTEGLLKLDSAQVIYIYENDYYVRDTSGVVIFRDPVTELKVRDMMKGSIYGQLSKEGKNSLFLAVEDMTTDDNLTITTGNVVRPRVVKISELTDDDIGDYIKVERVALAVESDHNLSVAMIQDSVKRVALYNLFRIKGIKMPADLEATRFDITGIYGSRMLSVNGQPFDDIYFTTTMKEYTLRRFTFDYTVDEGAHLLMNDVEMGATGQETFLEQSDVRLKVVIDEDYELELAMLDDEDITEQLLSKESLSIQNISGNHILTVSTKAREDISGIEMLTEHSENMAPVFFRIDGQRVESADLPGIYLVRVGKQVFKIVRK